MRKPNNFTMIELMLALGVCAIGICSIMVLFPIGANANRDAAMETYAANAADQLLHYLQYQLTTDADWNLVYSESAEIKSEIPEEPEGGYSLQVLNDLAADDEDKKWSNLSGNIYKNKDKPQVFQVISHRSGDSKVDVERIDFRAILFVWKKQITVNRIEIPENIGVQLNVQVTWPAELPYAARQKALYCLKVFNPNYLKPADD